MTYSYKITNTYHYYGYPQSEDHYKIESSYFSGTVKHYGNQGFSHPQITHKYDNNGYFWSMHLFMKAFYNDELRKYFRNLKEGETITIKLEEEI